MSFALEHVHGALDNMLHMITLEGKENINATDREKYIIDDAWAVSSTHHYILGSSLGAAVFV